MNDLRSMFSCLVALLATPCSLAAQSNTELMYAEEPVRQSAGFFQFVLSGGVVGLVFWSALLALAVAVLPLGILSIVQSATSRFRRTPLTIKLLACGGLFSFVFGCAATVISMIRAFANMTVPAPGVAQQAMMAMHMAQSTYLVGAGLLICLIYLVFFTVSLIVLHVRQRSIQT